MKKFVAIILYLSFSQTIFSQKSECENFKTGKFLYKCEGFPEVIVTRTDKDQIEVVQDSEDEWQENITWLSDCRYKQTYIKCPLSFIVGKSQIVEIFNVKENVAQGKSSFQGKTIEFIIEKIE